MEISAQTVKSILTPQDKGFLSAGPFPFTHSLSPYTGCGFGQTTCGLYCYAQFLPNWTFKYGNTAWGSAITVKENAAERLEETLAKMKPHQRARLRIFMSSTTDPYQPIEAKYGVTRRCLEVFSRYPDLDLLAIQTRGPLAERDFDLVRKIPYAWLSVTIETDDQALIKSLRGGPPLAKRFALVEKAARLGINSQITVSPCLPYTENFADTLANSGACRIIVDNFVAGDGSGGQRTARSKFATFPGWNDENISVRLYERLQKMGVEVGWSVEGFASIPPKNQVLSFEF